MNWAGGFTAYPELDRSTQMRRTERPGPLRYAGLNDSFHGKPKRRACFAYATP